MDREAKYADAVEYFKSIDEPFACGFFEEPSRGKFYRMCKGWQRFLQHCTMETYSEGSLYPCGKALYHNYGVSPNHSNSFWVQYAILEKKFSPEYVQLIREELDVIEYPETPHYVAGKAYVHSFPNYSRIENEGLLSYRERVSHLKDSDFRSGLLCLLDGISDYHSRVLKLLHEKNAQKRLIDALERVPFLPARSLYEAIVCRNFIFYLDLCDEPGRIDQELIQFYNGEDVVDLLREFFANINDNNAWSCAIGPDYNALTLQVLRASKGMRRPLVELRITKDMPDEVWEVAIDSIKAGTGSPSLYNEELYQNALRKKFPTIPVADLLRFNGGGCSETMLAGISRVGSIDAGVNLALVFRESLIKKLNETTRFEDFYNAVCEDIKTTTQHTVNVVNYIYTQRMTDAPHPMRTLLIDDCIDNETDFNSGGARYSWCTINFAGIINVIDSMLAIRELVFVKKKYTAKDFLDFLDNEDEEFYAELRKCPCFGVDDSYADSLAAQFAEWLFSLLDEYRPVYGLCFLPCSIQHVTYSIAGEDVGATPDGRRKGEPLCDSLAAIHGKDVKGPTAMLNSVAKLHLSKALGTPVLNLSMSPDHIGLALKPLITGFFEQGGMQVQITCVSKDDMIDAMVHPEKHENLIVRIGGYSEYFNRLSDTNKRSVINRTIQC